MDSLNSAYQFVKRNKWKVIGTTTAVSLGAWIYTASQRRAQAVEAHHKAQVLQNASTITKEVLANLIPQLERRINEVSKIPETLEQVRKADLSRDEKLRLWDQLKLSAFACTVTTGFTLSLLVGITRLLISLMSKYVWKSTQKRRNGGLFALLNFSAEEDLQHLSQDVHHEAISVIKTHVLHNTVPLLMRLATAAAEPLLSSWSLKKECTFDEILQMLMTIRVSVEGELRKLNADNIFVDLVCPPECGVVWTADREESLVYESVPEDMKTHLLLGELKDVCESFSFIHTMEKCLQTVLAAEAVKVKDFFEGAPLIPNQESTSVAPASPSLPLSQSANNTRAAIQTIIVAKILPSLSAVVASTLDLNESAALVALGNSPDLTKLASAVFNEKLFTLTRPW